ncbi:MAG: radical SAM protein [Dehalococcoidia bacterium]
MKSTSIELRQKDTAVVSLVEELSEHPDLSSEEIAKKLGLSREELLECYDIIRGNEELQRHIIEMSVAPRLTNETSDLLTKYGSYVTELISGERVHPLILEFHPGPVCNSRCGFCFSDHWEYAEYVLGEDLISGDRVLEIFDECWQNGVKEIWFSGGKEPFINPLTPEYIRAANQIGLRTKVYTNGISMTRQAQESVLDSYQVRISCSGAKPSTFNKIQFPMLNNSQSDSIHNKVIENVASLVRLKNEKNKKVKICMSQILQPLNHDEMLEFANLGLRLGVDSVHFRLEAMGMVREFTDYEKETMLSEIAELKKNHNGIELDIRGVAEGEFESRETQFLPRLTKPTLCRAGLLKRGLNPYGALYNCEFSSHPRFRIDCAHCRLGDAKQESIGEILRRNVGQYPHTCALCQAHEYGLNIALEKIQRDLEYGIPVDRQPYCRGPNNGQGGIS